LAILRFQKDHSRSQERNDDFTRKTVQKYRREMGLEAIGPRPKGWMYLVAVIDWHSRFVISWVLDQSLAVDFVLEAVDQALLMSQPKIWNSDQGSQFTNPQYIDRLEIHGIQISMDGRGRTLDNAFTDRLWRSVKYEEVYLNDYQTPREARIGLKNYFEFYNYHRPHQSLQYQTPAEVYFKDGNIVQLSQVEMEDSTLF
jgi:putative transposase